jgi:hypothetical protein
VGVLLGNGDGTFRTAVTYGSGGWQAVSVAVADVNGDGKSDLLVGNCSISLAACDEGGIARTVGVLLGKGNGTFQTATTYGSGGYTALSLTVADVNGDNKPDLVVANRCGDSCAFDGTVGVLINRSRHEVSSNRKSQTTLHCTPSLFDR